MFFTTSLLLFTAVHILVIIMRIISEVSSYPHHPSRSVACLDYCRRDRPIGFTGSFSIDCENTKFTEKEQLECNETCSECWINDPYRCEFENLSSLETGPKKIKCESLFSQEDICKHTCDYHRPEHFLGPFEFHCFNTSFFPTNWDTQYCRFVCNRCPVEICDEDEYFYCPAVKETPPRPPPPPREPIYEGSRCESQCDKYRPERVPKDDNDIIIDQDAYQFYCFNKYERDDEKSELNQCIMDCETCPPHICDYTEYGDYFRCPPSIPTTTLFQELPKHGPFIVSWTIIILIAVVIIACIISTAFYGRISGRLLPIRRVEPVQVQTEQSILDGEEDPVISVKMSTSQIPEAEMENVSI